VIPIVILWFVGISLLIVFWALLKLRRPIPRYPRVSVPRTGPAVSTYLIRGVLTDGTEVAKVGVGGPRRIREHERRKWKLVTTHRWPDRKAAFAAERSVLNAVPKVPVDPSSMPQGGYTEVFPMQYLPKARQILDERYAA
jgi:hypothetical protein